MIWNGSQKRQGSCIFNCSEEQSLITIIEHSESLQTHLALLIWEQESTKHKFLFCSLRQKSLLLFFSPLKINKIRDLRISKRKRKRLVIENETSSHVSMYRKKRHAKKKKKKPDNTLSVHFITLKLKLVPKINILFYYYFFLTLRKITFIKSARFGPVCGDHAGTVSETRAHTQGDAPNTH